MFLFIMLIDRSDSVGHNAAGSRASGAVTILTYPAWPWPLIFSPGGPIL